MTRGGQQGLAVTDRYRIVRGRDSNAPLSVLRQATKDDRTREHARELGGCEGGASVHVLYAGQLQAPQPACFDIVCVNIKYASPHSFLASLSAFRPVYSSQAMSEIRMSASRVTPRATVSMSRLSATISQQDDM